MKKIFFIFFCLMMTVGFRPFPGYKKWPIDLNNNKLWVRFCSRPTMTINNFKSGDPLYGQAVSFTTMTQSVFDDYNSISTAFVRLYDADTDPLFVSSNTANRIIDACFTTTPFGQAGNSQRTTSGNIVTGCKINLDHSLTSSAKNLVSTLTHELGHCLGLDHPQDTTNAVMSYFSTSSRLQIDDKAGITFLYASDSEYSQETPTFGMSCVSR